MKRGQIYYIESNHQEIGSEQRAGRPAVIVSNNKNNENSTTVEVVYMTMQPKNDLPTHVFIRSSLRPSTVLCEQIYSVSTERLGTYIGELTDRELQELDIALSISLGLDWMQPETSPGGVPDMKNSLQDLNNYLFESLERINDDDLTDEELEKEIKRSEAVTKVASTIINNAEVQLKALQYADEYGYNNSGKHLVGSMVPELEVSDK